MFFCFLSKTTKNKKPGETMTMTTTTTTMTSATTTTVATAEVAAAAQKPPDPHFQVGVAWRLLKGFIADNSRQMRSEREGVGGTEGKRERERRRETGTR